MRIAIVEDNLTMQNQLHTLLSAIAKKHDINIKVSLFNDGQTFLDQFKDEYDLVYLDVEMPRLDGMQTAQRIRELKSNVYLVFVTNYVQYAIEGYQVEAFDFLLKPINAFTFENHFNKFLKRFEKLKDDSSITIKYKNEVTRLSTQDILYVESEGHYLYFHTQDNTYTSLNTLKEIEKELQAYHFFRANNHYLVNLRYVSSVKEDMAYVSEHKLKISRPRKKHFMQALTDYLGDQ